MSQTDIWTERYRPDKFEEVVGQSEIIKRTRSLVQALNIPHLLFAGPAGTGKSTLALIIVKELFGDIWKQNYLELNASDERGIDVVRQKVKDFARTKALGNVSFKVIFLDEADALTQEAQQALRRTMENYTNTCRFILSCVTPDTKILLPEEVEISIEDFMKNFENKTITKVQNFKGNISKEDLVLASVRLNPKLIGKKTLEITTMTGRKIKVTEDHKLFTNSGWKEAGKINKEDKLYIYPNLESTYFENNSNKIVDIQKFIGFLSENEEKSGLKIMNNNNYRNLKTLEKNKIIVRAKELFDLMSLNKGITKREKEVYEIIKDKINTSRLEIQRIMGLSRIRTAQLLKSLEIKGYVTRYIDKNKSHCFTALKEDATKLRNSMDIKNIIEKEFGIKISYSGIKNALDIESRHGKVDRVIGELKRKNIIDIAYNDKKIGALSRIVAFMFGDGHIVKNDIRLYFSGNKEALENVKKDLVALGYNNFSKTFDKYIENKIGGREIKGTSTAFYLDSRSLSLFLQYLGVPKGDKVAIEYKIPQFIKEGTKFVKREFLRGLFGCEADKPSCRRYNFNAISLRQNKVLKLKDNMMEFYNELKELLNLFEIKSCIEVRDKGEIRKKDSEKVLTFSVVLKSSNDNLHKFFSRVGYLYEEYKMRLSRLASEYIKHKTYTIELLKEKSKLIEIEINGGKSQRSVAKLLDCSKDFVALQLKGKKINLPRRKFLTFDNWVKKYENGSFVENEITEIKEIECNDVRDIACFEDHNFIANSFLSHNCNYSSKIIDPIQSRCVVFRFKLLEKKDIATIIKRIAEKEKLKMSDDSFDALYEASEGDCRRTINLLQATASISPDINAEMVNIISSSSKPANIRAVLDYALSGDFSTAREKLLDVMLKESIAGIDIVKAIQKEIWNLPIEPEIKVKLTEKTGETEFRMIEGSDEFVQLQALLASFVLAGRGIKA